MRTFLPRAMPPGLVSSKLFLPLVQSGLFSVRCGYETNSTDSLHVGELDEHRLFERFVNPHRHTMPISRARVGASSAWSLSRKTRETIYLCFCWSTIRPCTDGRMLKSWAAPESPDLFEGFILLVWKFSSSPIPVPDGAPPLADIFHWADIAPEPSRIA